MTFEQNFKASSYCMIGAGFTAVAVSGRLHWLPVSLFASVFIAGWFINTDRLHAMTPKWLLNCLSILYFLFFIADLMLLSRSFMVAAVHLILFASIVKLLTLSKNRDYFFLYLASFTALLAASSLKINLIFGICFLIFLFSGIHAFILFEMRLSNSAIQKRIRIHPFVASNRPKESNMELFSPFPTRLLTVISFGITLLVLIVALPLFLLLPRSGSDYNRQPSGETQFVSGFSESVELGRIGRIRQSDTIVMRVRISKSPSQLPVDLKWRGLAFDYYDGRAWKRSDPVRYPVPTQGRYFKLEDFARGTDWLQQSFFLESLSTDVVFAARNALAVSREAGTLLRDSAENLYASPHEQSKLRYDVISDRIRPDPDFISDRGAIPAEVLETCLQIPHLDCRIEDLTQKVIGSAGGNYEKAKALERHLRTQYAYSLELKGIPGSKDPLAMFLFETRQGHCEYFASAMAIMLRIAGIPSRLVNGFRIGEYNRIGDSWIVRQYHAHSWVETYLPPYGWMEFDPTPVQRLKPRTAFAQFWTDMADAVDLWWWERVVNYDYSRQYNVIASVYSASAKILDSVRDLAARVSEKSREGLLWLISLKETPGHGMVWLGMIPLFIIMALLIRPLRKRVLKRMRPVLYRNRPRLYAGSFYTEALEILSKYGMVRAPSQTPMEFAKDLSNHPAGTSLFALTRLYNTIRFGPPDAPPRKKEAEQLLQSLREDLFSKK
ncbi:MAG: DUF3488 domain-containing protein [Acidobacteria bacterium]|nr:DUF3488 domain-containing protein [Acidobacteriota bacterium]